MIVLSGNISPISGYFIYKGNPKPGVMPCFLSKKERIVVLNKGDTAPYVTCNNYHAVWKLVVEKKSTPLLHH